MRRTGATRSQKFEARRWLARPRRRARLIRASGGPTEKKGPVWITRFRTIPESWQGIEGAQEGSPLQPRYRPNDINTAPSCTGYINIMLSRFLVKRAPPRETVASADWRLDTLGAGDVKRAGVVQEVG